MATQTTTTSASVDRSRGRGYLWAGIGLALLAITLWIGQYVLLKQLFVPWYVPAVTTLGALLLLASVIQRRGVIRILVLVLIAGLAGLEWFFIASFSRLPTYEGPAQAGAKLPAFQTTLADGKTFTNQDLHDGTKTVMVFFRGRW